LDLAQSWVGEELRELEEKEKKRKREKRYNNLPSCTAPGRYNLGDGLLSDSRRIPWPPGYRSLVRSLLLSHKYAGRSKLQRRTVFLVI
jgi:hypothetical protein